MDIFGFPLALYRTERDHKGIPPLLDQKHTLPPPPEENENSTCKIKKKTMMPKGPGCNVETFEIPIFRHTHEHTRGRRGGRNFPTFACLTPQHPLSLSHEMSISHSQCVLVKCTFPEEGVFQENLRLPFLSRLLTFSARTNPFPPPIPDLVCDGRVCGTFRRRPRQGIHFAGLGLDDQRRGPHPEVEGHGAAGQAAGNTQKILSLIH